jgi:hypothetical protein
LPKVETTVSETPVAIEPANETEANSNVSTSEESSSTSNSEENSHTSEETNKPE